MFLMHSSLIAFQHKYSNTKDAATIKSWSSELNCQLPSILLRCVLAIYSTVKNSTNFEIIQGCVKVLISFIKFFEKRAQLFSLVPKNATCWHRQPVKFMVKVKSDGQGHVEYRTAAGTFGLKQELKTKAKSEKKTLSQTCWQGCPYICSIIKNYQKSMGTKEGKNRNFKKYLKILIIKKIVV